VNRFLWHWLVPPRVSDGQGRLQPRRPPPAAAPPALPAPPLANYSTQLGADCSGQTLHYRLHRSQRRRSIGFSVNAQGLTVYAPAWLGLDAVTQAVQEKSGWIVRQLHHMQQRQRAQQAARVRWEQGGVLDWLGQELQLHLDGPPRRAAVCQALDGGGHALHLPVPASAAPEQVRACVQAWMQQQARAWFGARLQHYAPLLGVQWRKLRLSSARTRWGSASSHGTISLHWRLMQHAAPVIDYVVVHELAHLRHMDHSAQFWATVASVLPHWQAQRQTLRQKRLPPWE